MRPLDEAIKKPEAAGTGAYIEVVTEADERLRMNEKDLPGGRAMRHLVRSRKPERSRRKGRCGSLQRNDPRLHVAERATPWALH